MRNYRKLLLLIPAVALAAVLAVVVLRPSDEPRYKGRTLDQWIQANRQWPGDPQAREAIVNITTNSVPLLLQRLTADTASEERLEAKLPAFLRTSTVINRFLYRKRYLAACSALAFRVSGTNAACATPEVAQLINGRYPPMVKTRAMMILKDIGPAALPSIREAMKNPDALVRGLAIYATGQFGTNAVPAIPDLVAALSDADLSVRANATKALETLAPDALTNAPAK